jgi:monovalent cation/hydrogen antiporter
MEALLAGLELLLAVALVAAAGKRIPIPLPILLVAAGWGLAFVPRYSGIQLDPAVFFVLFIPPLLFSDGWLIPKRELAQYLRPILLLAFGLVALTVVVVGYVVHWMIPSIPLAAAFALGAVISPTDAVAAAAVTEKLKLPRRIVNIINGESLINDASGLVAFKFAVAAAATGAFSAGDAAVSLVVVSLGGLAIGLAVAWTIGVIRVWLERRGLSEPAIQAVFSLLTPFAAYILADHLQLSGILSVVVAGIYAGYHDTRNLTTSNRLHTWEVWTLVLFALNGMVFLLLGLELPRIFAAIDEQGGWELAGYALAVSALVIALRMAWVFPGAWLPRWVSRRVREREPAPPVGGLLVLGWAGIRGTVTLAAALSIPIEAAAGVPFPGRDLVIFLAASVILVTLVLNTLTLPALIRWAGLTADAEEEREQLEARLGAARAAIGALEARLAAQPPQREQVVIRMLIAEYEERIAHLLADGDERRIRDASHAIEQRLRCVALTAERDALFELRDRNRINEDVLRLVQRELDYWESAMFGSAE